MLECSLTGLYPYAGHDPTDRLSVWAVAGDERPELTLSLPCVERRAKLTPVEG